MIKLTLIVFTLTWIYCSTDDSFCPPQELILPCRCSQRSNEVQIWCSHSDLPRVLHGIKSVAKTVNHPIDELILENNQLPSLPGRFFSPLHVLRLMLRYNALERLASGWLSELEDSLVEIFIVENNLRSISVDSLNGFRKLEAVTIQSEHLKRVPDFSGLTNLKYISVQSASLFELMAGTFNGLSNLETVSINGSPALNRLEAGLLVNIRTLSALNFANNGINWIHLRALANLPGLKELDLSGNRITDAGMIGRAVKDLTRLEVLKLSRNHISVLNEGSFVDLPMLKELHLNDNIITAIHQGAFHRIPNLKTIQFQNNYLSRIHPESFLQSTGSGVEFVQMQNNAITRIEELRSILDSLPMLRFLDLSYNKLESIPFGAIRGHANIEQLHLNHNQIRMIEKDSFMAMPALRELRMKNNSLSETLPLPFWNLPNLKGLDLSLNRFKTIDSILLVGLPSLRHLDLSQNDISVLEPNTFQNAPMLETINLSENQIGNIHPATFRALDNLFELDISGNQLREMINGLPRIVERVILRNNKIQNLPLPSHKSFELPNLRMLDISENLIQRLPRSSLKSLKELRVLNLAKNRLQSIDEESLLGLNKLESLNMQDNRLMAFHEKSMQSLRELKDLNVQGNRIELLTEHVMDNMEKLERFDISRNNLVEISPGSFRKTRSLQSIDLSENHINGVPDSLLGLSDLKELDLSFNQISNLPDPIVNSWRGIEELRMSNNKLPHLQHGCFRNLPSIQYLDLSSNEIHVLEPGAIYSLPELQELVLADNRIQELQDRVFEGLPNLQAVHLQQNNIGYISPNSFIQSPNIVYMNLSTNHIRYLEHTGLRSIRNVEVLDLSNNGIRRITSNPLRGLDWLVELKLDDNQICKVQGEPFVSMPRLRVLSMKNNRMSMLPERTFRSLRGNIAVLDLDGNPLECSCDMLWLRAWLQEVDSHYPGPRCHDGNLLREMRLSRSDCPPPDETNSINHSNGHNTIPLTNEHGDVFVRKLENNLCDIDPNEELTLGPIPPTPTESEYFYDQYIDVPLINDTKFGHINNTDRIPPIYDRLPANAQLNPINLTNTLLNYNQFKQQQESWKNQQRGGPAFTFFGLPIPSLGNLWNQKGRTANHRAVTGTRGKGRVQIYRPDDPQVQEILKHNGSFDWLSEPSYGSQTIDEKLEQESNLLRFKRPHFQTNFPQPQPEAGGFSPIIPGASGGFIPNRDPFGKESTTLPSQPHEAIDQEAQPDHKRRKITNESLLSLNNYFDRNFTKSEEINDDKKDGHDDRNLYEESKRYNIVKDPTPVPNLADQIVVINKTGDIHLISSTLPNNPQNTNRLNTKITILDETERPEEDQTLIEVSTEATTLATIRNKTLVTDNIQKIKNLTNYNFWNDTNLPASTLSGLVAPGAQQGGYHRTPPGRPTITKVFTTPAPVVQIEESASRLTKPLPDEFTKSESPFLAASPEEQIPRKKNMDWYYNNYNKTTTISPNYIQYGSIGLKHIQSNGIKLNCSAYFVLVSMCLIMFNIYN